MTTEIASLRVGQQARIKKYRSGNIAYRQKLIAMGLLPNTILTVKRIAPLGDPIEIEVRDFALTLRKSEASILEVELL